MISPKARDLDNGNVSFSNLGGVVSRISPGRKLSIADAFCAENK